MDISVVVLLHIQSSCKCFDGVVEVERVTFFLPFNAVVLETLPLCLTLSNPQSKDCTAIMKKALRETQTLRAGCSKAEPNIFAPPRVAGRPKFNQLEMVTTLTYRSSFVKMDW